MMHGRNVCDSTEHSYRKHKIEFASSNEQTRRKLRRTTQNQQQAHALKKAHVQIKHGKKRAAS